MVVEPDRRSGFDAIFVDVVGQCFSCRARAWVMEQKLASELFRIPLNHADCTWLGVQGRNEFEISNGCGESTKIEK